MRVKLQPPPGYKPLPPDLSETVAKYRWPIANPRQPIRPPEGQISVDGPLQTPPPKPRLRYHRQSSYTDDYIQFPARVDRCTLPKSEWSDPIGKRGKFVGKSVYEDEYEWPSDLKKVTRLAPLISTVGFGILPIVDPVEDGSEMKAAEEVVKCSSSSERPTEPSYWVLNCNPGKPVDLIWEEQTTHRTDYKIPPRTTKRPTRRESRPPDETQFQFSRSGKMETVTTSMRDYRNFQAVEQCVCGKVYRTIR